MRLFKKLASLLICAVLLLSVAGCKSSSSSAAPSTPATPTPSSSSPASAVGSVNPDQGLLDRASKLLKAQGREYDKLYVGGMNETLTCSFFDFSITSAELADEFAGYGPQQEGFRFLIADVTVKNIFGEPIPVGNYDFNVLWNGGQDYAYESFSDDMYPDDVELAADKTLSGKLVFEVPVDAADIMIAYSEIYEDEFEGNTYAITIDL